MHTITHTARVGVWREGRAFAVAMGVFNSDIINGDSTLEVAMDTRENSGRCVPGAVVVLLASVVESLFWGADATMRPLTTDQSTSWSSSELAATGPLLGLVLWLRRSGSAAQLRTATCS